MFEIYTKKYNNGIHNAKINPLVNYVNVSENFYNKLLYIRVLSFNN